MYHGEAAWAETMANFLSGYITQLSRAQMLIRRSVEKKDPGQQLIAECFSTGTRKTHPSGWVGGSWTCEIFLSGESVVGSLGLQCVHSPASFRPAQASLPDDLEGHVTTSCRCVWQSAWVCFVSAGLRRSQRSLAGMISFMRCEVLLSPLYRTSAVQVLSFRPIIPRVCVSQVCFLISLMDGVPKYPSVCF